MEYVYDLVGKVQQVSDPTGTYGFAYDNMGRLIGTTTQYTFVAGTYSNSYTYDPASNRTGLTAPDGSTNTYGYDTLNRLNGLANSWAGSFGFGYDALSRRTQLTRPNGINTNYSYDSLSRLLSVLHQNGATTVDGATYTYDAAGNRTSKADQLANVTSNYGYDALYQLLQVTQSSVTKESYTYDAVGNRLSSSGVPTYNYNPSNELTSDSLGSYTYDNNGNTLTDASGKGYTWDFENRLLSAVVPGTGTVNFKYDPFGRRIQKSSSLGTTNYLYDGVDLIESANQNGNLIARYTQGPLIDESLAELTSGAASYFQADGLASVSSLSNSIGALANTYTYDSFGKLTASTGSLANPFQYTGREFDSETGIYYYRARYYDPATGRFIGEDPIQFGAGPNFYGYVGNNPVGRIDPLGLDWLKNLSDFSAGAGSVLSLGLTDLVNDATGASSVVDKCSLSHKLGTAAGIALSTAIGGAAGAEAAEANAGSKGFEFSHWIPDRMGGPRSIFNGNYVSSEMHYLTDPFRYPSGWPAWGPKLNPALQQLLRIPYVYDGAAAGAAVGGASALATGSCGCN